MVSTAARDSTVATHEGLHCNEAGEERSQGIVSGGKKEAQLEGTRPSLWMSAFKGGDEWYPFPYLGLAGLKFPPQERTKTKNERAKNKK